jgi:hypothetical protein
MIPSSLIWKILSIQMRNGLMGQRKDRTVYMHPDEEDPHKTVRNKNAIHKVMFFLLLGDQDSMMKVDVILMAS